MNDYHLVNRGCFVKNTAFLQKVFWGIILGILMAAFILPASAQEEGDINPAKDLAVNALLDRFDEGDGVIYVYRDFSLSLNHFTQKAKMVGFYGENLKDMDENWKEDVKSGRTAIRCEMDVFTDDWGGWMFLNGYLPEGEANPHINDGQTDGQGIDLSGAAELRFFAKGEKGGEKVEFFTAGFGYYGDSSDTMVPYPDSAKKHSLGYVTLTNDWKEYVIDLRDADMSYIICGFGFVLSSQYSNKGNNVFYLDEIRFVPEGYSHWTDGLSLLRSYDTDNIFILNAAYTYDNALAAMAFLSEGRADAAAKILDGFVYAVNHDRYKPDRIRNAYMGGPIEPYTGWEHGINIPGWWNQEAESWYEDRYQTGSNTGNTAYAALALLQYDRLYGNETYRETARILMDRILEENTDGWYGFTAGYDGWPEADVVYEFTYKSIEHNIDAYAAFTRLYELTGEQKYSDAADSALRFIYEMYDPDEKYFHTGTDNDGITHNKGVIALDTIVWNQLALGEKFEPYQESLETVSAMRTADGGYPFSMGNDNGGWWPEGTAFTALMYHLLGEEETAAVSMNALINVQLKNGLFPAATVDEMPTGFFLFTGESWNYEADAHVAPTAWFIMAANGFNPYAF